MEYHRRIQWPSQVSPSPQPWFGVRWRSSEQFLRGRGNSPRTIPDPGIIHCAITVTLWITRIGLGESLLILAVVRYYQTHRVLNSRYLFLLREKSNQVAAQWSLRSHCDAPHHDNHLTVRREAFMPDHEILTYNGWDSVVREDRESQAK